MFRRELFRNSMWVSNQPLEAYELCFDCYALAGTAIAMAARGEGNSSDLLGIPIPQSQIPRSPALCGYCRRELKDEAVGADLIPSRRDFVRRSLFRHVGHIQQHRLCSACYYWTRSIIEYGSAMRRTSTRVAEGPAGGWLSVVDLDAATYGLLRRDDFVVEQTVRATGRSHHRLSAALAAAGLAADPSMVLFVGAARSGRASAAVRDQTRDARARTVVVASADCPEDAFQALAAGAGDLIVSPLSPQQITGAFDRLKDTESVLRRDPATGLPIYREDSSRFGMPANQIIVTLQAGTNLMEAAIYARRFVRGYDRVGLDEKGNLHLQVYCPEAHVGLVIARLESLAGAKAKFSSIQHAALDMAA